MPPMTLTPYQLHTPYGRIAVAEYGGQLLSWQSAEGRERLYYPESLQLLPGRALRGGVPICFPQFSGRGPLPKHGLVRTRPWRLCAQNDTSLVLCIEDDADTRAQWPHAFALQQTLTLSAEGLSIALDVHNCDSSPLTFTAALHTYLRVPDVRDCALQGLHAHDYEDAADQGRYKRQLGALRIAGEVDRVFSNAPSRLHLHYGQGEILQIEQGGFADTVVWCPGPQLAATLSDMPATDWQHLLCVEAAAAAQPVTVATGGHWQGWQRFRISP